MHRLAVLLTFVVTLSVGRARADRPYIEAHRTPDGGIQPQVAVDGKGMVHLVYFKGRPAAGDLFYVHAADDGEWSRPIRVNSEPGSAIAIGNIRGAHLALGRNGRVHVAWNGSSKAKPRARSTFNDAPMLYTRLNDEGTAFEPQRNIIQYAPGLDGGGSVAADGAGNVYVTWHAPVPGARGEENRCVWVARSRDDGRTFAREQRAWAEPTGACGCCGMRASADADGNLYLLYRGVQEMVHRDMYLLVSRDHGRSFQGSKVGGWNIAGCPMSSEAFIQAGHDVLGAWENEEQVYFGRVQPERAQVPDPVAAPGSTRGRKYPTLAFSHLGSTLLVWTEGMGWERGGSVAWQAYDKDGKPTEARGRREGVPVWSLPAVWARADGGFTILY